ncbi:hypothetical protein PM082_002131 [Marasmius tenuissimus]|nr:hypothetical protein PM082_002131 [Marasmius tenuissimus]
MTLRHQVVLPILRSTIWFNSDSPLVPTINKATKFAELYHGQIIWARSPISSRINQSRCWRYVSSLILLPGFIRTHVEGQATVVAQTFTLRNP